MGADAGARNAKQPILCHANISPKPATSFRWCRTNLHRTETHELKLMALDLYYSRVIALNKTPSSSCLPSPPEAYGAKTSSKRSQNKFQQALCPAAASLLLRLVWELQVSLHRLGIHFWIDQFTLPSLRFPGPRV